MRPKPNKGQIIALPGAARADDALKYLRTILENDKPDGVILITVVKGVVDFRFFGQIIRNELAWAGATLSYEAVRED